MFKISPHDFATEAHKGQLRKFTDLPYITHPLSVAELLSEFKGVNDNMLAAAVLHDVVEDTAVTVDQIAENFNQDIAFLVMELTKKGTKAHGPRVVRKAIDMGYLAQASVRAQTIKLADIADNVKDVHIHAPKFAKVYLPENLALIEVLVKGDRTLYHMTKGRILYGMQEVGITSGVFAIR